MKNIKKIALIIAISLIATILVPTFVSAESRSVGTEQELIDTISKSKTGDIIELSADIYLTKPLGITDKNLTIDGNGFKISKAEGWQNDGSNGTLITVGKGSKVTLKGLTLTGSAKYGVQAYNSGHVVLDKVTITDNKFGGVLVNAGTVEIVDLTLGRNGDPDNNGIEISKGDILDGSVNPKIIMNGKITTDEKENVIYIAVNDENLTEYSVENTDTSEQKIYVSGNQIIVTDSNNKVLFESNVNDEVTPKGEDYVENVTVTVHLNDKTVTKDIKKGTILTREDLEKDINLDDLDLSEYTLAGFYLDKDYTTVFEFDNEITSDTTIYAKLDLDKKDDDKKTDDDKKDNDKKDDTPKTGVQNYFVLTASAIVMFIVAVIVSRRKEF